MHACLLAYGVCMDGCALQNLIFDDVNADCRTINEFFHVGILA
jgi:hypothetical protein